MCKGRACNHVGLSRLLFFTLTSWESARGHGSWWRKMGAVQRFSLSGRVCGEWSGGPDWRIYLTLWVFSWSWSWGKNTGVESWCAIIFHCLKFVGKNLLEGVVGWHHLWRWFVWLSACFTCNHPLLYTATVCFLISLPFPVSCCLNP